MKVTNKMLAEAFGKSEQNFKQIQPDLRKVYVDAYKFRAMKDLASTVSDVQIKNTLNIIHALQDN